MVRAFTTIIILLLAKTTLAQVRLRLRLSRIIIAGWACFFRY